MQIMGILLALVVVVMGVQSWHEENGTFRNRPNIVYDALAPSTAVRRSAAPRLVASGIVSGNRPIAGDDLKLAHEDALRIVTTAKSYGVPEGALFGIWMMESRGLRQGWNEASDRWIPARDLSRADSKCAANYDAERCAARWQAVRALCNQKVAGRVLCEPNEVRTTFGMAMGPLQHMPNVVLRPNPAGGYFWAPQAVDADHDGFRNPFDTDDALAWTALEILGHHDRSVTKGSKQPWRSAVIRYSGFGNDPYYDGRIKDGKRIVGVGDYWAAWQQCRKEGTCPATFARIRGR